MIQIQLEPHNHVKSFYFFEYYDPIQKKEIHHPIADDSIESMRFILQKRLGTNDIKLIAVYTEVEVE